MICEILNIYLFLLLSIEFSFCRSVRCPSGLYRVKLMNKITENCFESILLSQENNNLFSHKKIYRICDLWYLTCFYAYISRFFRWSHEELRFSSLEFDSFIILYFCKIFSKIMLLFRISLESLTFNKSFKILFLRFF